MHNVIKNPEAEQQLCISCGFCCDGTLFELAWLKPGEKGTMPPKIEESYVRNNHGEFFHLPCSYFCNKCTIYNKSKPEVCSDYRCKVLKDFSRDKISQHEASGIIRNAMLQRKEIIQLAQSLWDIQTVLPFRFIKKKLREFKPEEHSEPKNKMAELLAVKCMVFEILLMKHFCSKKDFDKMYGTPEDSEENTALANQTNIP